MTDAPSLDIRLQYAGLYLLDLLDQHGDETTRLVADGEEVLEPVLKWLVRNEYALVRADDTLYATSRGKDVVHRFQQKYRNFLRNYDVFCAVDLGEGTFAFAEADNFSEGPEWHAYLAQGRWTDLRVAVAEHEGEDSFEAVFMGFVAQGTFGGSDQGWNFDRVLGSVWDEIARVHSSAVRAADLGYEDEQGTVPGEDVIADVIAQGRELIARIRTPLRN